MSLFGDFADDPPSTHRANASKSSLFDDERPGGNRNSTSLFAEEDSPWGMPAPKRGGRAQVVKSLLADANIPDGYVDIFDHVLAEGHGKGAGVSLEGVRKVLAAGALDNNAAERIMAVVLPAGEASASENGIGRSEFNVLLALIALAQEGDDIGLDAVDYRRRNLPIPTLKLTMFSSKSELDPAPSDDVTSKKTPAKSQSVAGSPETTPSRKKARQPSFGYESDPWGSPDLHRGHNHAATNGVPSHINGSVPHRTTSAFTTTSSAQESTAGGIPATPASTAGDSGWGGYTGSASDSFANSSMGGGFGASAGGDGNSGPNRNDPTGLGQPLPIPRAGNGVEEVITVTALPEKEGMFMFQHRNYEVASARRASKVIRRYSDFVWLLDCLHKRYPFRQLPLLPPKRVAINGNYLATDASFVERRRRGLARFANALVRHPVLSQEQLVTMFLTVPTELAVWRKQATISVTEEFAGKELPPGLEDSLPANLEELFQNVRSGVRRSAEIYINLCNQMERLIKRNEGIAAEYARISAGLNALTDASKYTYGLDTNDVPLLNEGLKSTAKHLSASQSLLEDEARAWDEGVLEDLKKQRDCLVCMRDVFDRRDRYDRDNIPQLEKRIKNNEDKLIVLRNRPEGVGKPGDIEKVEDAILKDKQSIVAQHARHIFVKQCIRDELRYFQGSQYAISRLHQDWAQERVKYAELQADNWRALAEEVEGMPLASS
ncbi:uncharacterized protein PV09_08870 [Verruconis gallopava]|uniref:Sorting nexin MVP1 n=1 Tax=Verruconis gallopava TaxID=253628 RepID=A0A0D1ZZF5_9PEZI|nr:uncharacterized protein PV09_08870 [Verruconis gallopava]KIV99439.1 hypothetical protein PV09_08870 [Verruconis gallopava]